MKYEEMKKICQNILSEEMQSHNLKTTSYVFGKLTYYNSNYFKNKFMNSLSLTKRDHHIVKNRITTIIEGIKNFYTTLNFITIPFNVKGFYNDTDDAIIIFINNYDQLPFPSNIYAQLFLGRKTKITNLLVATYHEIYHAIDWNKSNGFDIGNYDQFACDIERFKDKYMQDSSKIISIIDNFKYMHNTKYHDSFMYEILANQYGIRKTKEFIMKNPNAYDYNLDYLNKLEQRYNEQYNNYNLSKNLDVIIDNYNILLKKILNFDKRLFEIFLNDNGTFKDIKTSLLDERLKFIDKRILQAFYNTQAFINNVQIQMTINPNYITQIEENEHSKSR